MPVALCVLAMGEEALRGDEVKIVLGACHGDIEQAALLLDLGGCPCAEVGGNEAVDGGEYENRPREIDDAVGGGKDRLRRAIVPVQRDDLSWRAELSGEVEDVAHR